MSYKRIDQIYQFEKMFLSKYTIETLFVFLEIVNKHDIVKTLAHTIATHFIGI